MIVSTDEYLASDRSDFDELVTRFFFLSFFFFLLGAFICSSVAGDVVPGGA